MIPRISFIIATRDRASLIARTLQSLIDQTEKEWEAVIVDDVPSSDNTEEIVASFGDIRFRYYKLTPDHGQGASCARNFAAIEAKASIVAILDSDDICYPNRVAVTLKAFDENPDADVFYANIDVFEEETGVVRERKTPFTEYSLERIKAGNFIPHPTVAIKRQVLLDNPYNQFFTIAEDYDLYTRLAKAGKKFIYSKEKILKYRIGRDNTSVGVEKEEITKSFGALVKMIRGWEELNPDVLTIIERRK